MRNPLFLAAFACIIAPAFAFQSVHVVNGGSGAALQAAVDGAASGDTVLVHGGSFSAVSIVGKSLTIVAEPALGTLVTNVTIANLAAGQTCVVAGLDVLASPTVAAIRVNDCLGSVRLQSVRARSIGNTSADALAMSAAVDVVCAASTFVGGAQIPTPGPNSEPTYPVGRGIACTNSQLAVFDCSVTGGLGQTDHFINTVFGSSGAGRGGSALVADATSFVMASRSSFAGGNGGQGRGLSCGHLPCGIWPTPGGAGGTGIDAHAGSNVAVLDVLVAGGSGGIGGAGGQCCPGPTTPSGATGAAGVAEQGVVTQFAGTGASLVAQNVVRAGNQLALTVTGTPGDMIVLGVSSHTRFVFDPAYSGVLVLGTAARRALVGVVPAGGILGLSIAPGTLPPGAQAIERYVQVVARDPFGQLRLGAPAAVTLIDPAF